MDDTQKTLANIVMGNQYAIPVLERYQLDYCCKGNRTLADACFDKGLETGLIVEELKRATPLQVSGKMPFNQMTAAQLINYIVTHHHQYVKQILPQTYYHLEKVSGKHGGHFPYMIEVFRLFEDIKTEMTGHMEKEEMILFPRIIEAERLASMKDGYKEVENFISGPILVMEAEHEHAGSVMLQIRSLTNNYTAPDSACTTFKLALSELKAFEEDLHRHVHLENNILFPLAKQFS